MKSKFPIIIMGSKKGMVAPTDNDDFVQAKGYAVIDINDIQFYMDASTKLDVVTLHLKGDALGELVVIPVHLNMASFENKLRKELAEYKGALGNKERELLTYLESIKHLPNDRMDNNSKEDDREDDTEGLY